MIRAPLRSGRSRAVVLAPLLAALLVGGRPLRGDAPTAPTAPTAAELVAARGWFEQGVAAEERDDFTAALALFRKVAAVKLNPVVYFHLGLCLEKTGALVAARDHFLLARAGAQHDGGVDAERIVAIAGKHLASLDGRIPSVRVARDAGDGDASLLIDGKVMPASLLGAIVPLDPGPHDVEVHATGRAPFVARVELIEGHVAPIELAPTLARLADAPPAEPASHAETRGRPWPWIAGGVGLVAVAGAGVFYGLRASALSSVDATCAPGRVECDPAARDTEARGRTYTTVGNVLLGVGTVSLGAALVLLVTGADAPTTSASATATTATSVRVEPTVGLGGLGLVGRF